MNSHRIPIHYFSSHNHLSKFKRPLEYHRRFDRFGFDIHNPANPPAWRSMAEYIALHPDQKERCSANILSRFGHIASGERRDRLIASYKDKMNRLIEGSRAWVFVEENTGLGWVRPLE